MQIIWKYVNKTCKDLATLVRSHFICEVIVDFYLLFNITYTFIKLPTYLSSYLCILYISDNTNTVLTFITCQYFWQKSPESSYNRECLTAAGADQSPTSDTESPASSYARDCLTAAGADFHHLLSGQ